MTVFDGSVRATLLLERLYGCDFWILCIVKMTSLVTPEQRAATLLKTHLMQVRKALEPFPGELVICRDDVLDSRFKVGPYRRINLQMHMVPSTYPKAGVVLDLSSPTVAPGVLKQLHTKCETLVKNAEGVDNVLLGIVNFVKGSVVENKLLCCIHEIRKAKRSLGGTLADLKINEKSGHVRMKFVEGKYSSTLDFMVPDRYPHDPVDLKLIKSTFPRKVVHIYEAQVREIVRKCNIGMSVELAMMASRPEKVPPAALAKKREIKITNESANQLKEDVKFLKTISDIRDMETAKDKRNQFLLHDNATRKAARRTLRKLAAKETAKEVAMLAEEEARQEAEDAALISAHEHGNGPTLHVGAIIDFVANHFVCRLPKEMCQGCQKPLMPKDPSEAGNVFSKENKQRARRVYCSHWWHHKCLDRCLTKPPFGTQGCPECRLRVWHHEWERDITRLEKRWAAKEAVKREMNDVTDSFGGLGAEFLVDKKKKGRTAGDGVVDDCSDEDSDASEDDIEDMDAIASATMFERW